MQRNDPDAAPPRARWRTRLRVAAMLVACAAAGLYMYALWHADALAVVRGTRPVGMAGWWWLSLALWALVPLLAWARVAGAAFVVAAAIALVEGVRLVFVLGDARVSIPGWLYEAVAYDAVVLWPGLLLAIVLALIEWRRRPRAAVANGGRS